MDRLLFFQYNFPEYIHQCTKKRHTKGVIDVVLVPLLLTNFAAIFGAFVACFEYLNVNWVIFPVLHSQKDKSMGKNKIGIKEFFEYWNRDFLIKFS